MFKKKDSTQLTEVKDKSKSKKIIKRVIIAAVVVVILALIILPKLFTPEVLPVVTTQTAFKGDVEQILSTSGFVESEDKRTYFADVNAKVLELNVEAGSNIHTGDKLVAYDTDALETALKQKELEDTASQAELSDTLAEGNKNAVKYQNSSHDVGILEQQVEDQTNYVESIQMTINDLANELSQKQSELSELSAETDPSKKTKKRIKELKSKIKNINNTSTDYTNELISAQNELSTLQSNLSEQKSIQASSEAAILSGNKKTQINANSSVSKMTVEESKKNLEKALNGIDAEFNGIVTEVLVAQGATVTEGTQLFTLANSKTVMVTIALTKYDLESVVEGQTAEITLGANKYTGTVDKISRVATKNAAGAAVINAQIHIDNPDDNIYLGVEAKVNINVGSAKNVVLIPVECVNTDNAGQFCYVVENGIVVRKPVVTGVSSNEYIEVKEGIKEGEAVVSQITAEITEGMAVNAIDQGAMNAAGTAAGTAAGADDAANTADDASKQEADNKSSETDSKEAEEEDEKSEDTESKDGTKKDAGETESTNE